ncbi:MAG: FG-GAP repeat protein, partial [Gammaproteobacteria bacterium]|nr:FG-GAP repeat protein [Gammaproteobacteria bacterium]
MKYQEKLYAGWLNTVKPALSLLGILIMLSLTACGGGSDDDGGNGPLVTNNIAQQVRLKANNPSFENRFGANVAMSGKTLAVGVPDEDTEGENAGAVYVFSRSGSDWVLDDMLTAENAEAGDLFGTSVALSGDTLVVGAPYEDGGRLSTLAKNNNALTDSGAVYVFTRTGSVWKPEALLKAKDNADPNDHFGESVALFGNTLVVGAPDENGVNHARTSAGAVYVFTGSGADWSESDFLRSSNNQAGDRFGSRVAVDSNTLAVAALGEDGDDGGSEDDSGAVYVFIRDNDGKWPEQQRIKVDNVDENDQFGFSVALSNDTLAVGVVGEDGDANSSEASVNEGATDAGAVYVFTRSGEIWSQQAYVKAGNAEAEDGFGTSVALSGDTLVIGAPREDGDAKSTAANPNDKTTDAGAAYIFTRDDGIWSQQSYLKADNAGASDQFGTSVVLSANTAAVGAP